MTSIVDYILINRYVRGPSGEEKILAHFDALNIHQEWAQYMLTTGNYEKKKKETFAYNKMKEIMEKLEANHKALDETEKEAPIISVFSHKGGVGKSTTVINLAGALAAMGRRVGIIDADDQGNTTQFFRKDYILQATLDNADEPNDTTEQLSSASPTSNTASASQNADALHAQYFLDPGAETLERDYANREPQGPYQTEVMTLGKFLSGMDLNDYSTFFENDPTKNKYTSMERSAFAPNIDGSGGGEIYFLPVGDVISETKLQENINKRVYLTCFRRLCNALAKRHNLDVIFVDLNPSKGLFNSWIVASGDFVLPPTTATQFGIQAAGQMWEKILPRMWQKQQEWHKQTLSPADLSGVDSSTEGLQKVHEARVFNPLTKVLPFLVNNFGKNNQARAGSSNAASGQQRQRTSRRVQLGKDDSIFILRLRTLYTSLPPKLTKTSRGEPDASRLPALWFSRHDAGDQAIDKPIGNEPAFLLGLENSTIVGASERCNRPISLLRKSHYNSESRRPRAQESYADVARHLIDSCGILNKPKLSLKDNEVERVVQLISRSVSSIVLEDSTETRILEQAFQRKLLQKLRDDILNCRNGWDEFPKAMVEDEVRSQTSRKRSDVVLWAHGPFDKRPVLIELKVRHQQTRSSVTKLLEEAGQQLCKYKQDAEVIRVQRPNARARSSTETALEDASVSGFSMISRSVVASGLCSECDCQTILMPQSSARLQMKPPNSLTTREKSRPSNTKNLMCIRGQMSVKLGGLKMM